MQPRFGFFASVAAVIATAVTIAGAVVLVGSGAGAGPGTEPGQIDATYVPIEPCRLGDTRPNQQVGPRTAWFLAEQPFGYEGGTELRVTLKYDSQYTQHVFGRVRFSTSRALMVPDLSASIWLSIFMASMMQRVSPAFTCWPTSTNGLAPGEGAS